MNYELLLREGLKQFCRSYMKIKFSILVIVCVYIIYMIKKEINVANWEELLTINNSYTKTTDTIRYNSYNNPNKQKMYE